MSLMATISAETNNLLGTYTEYQMLGRANKALETEADLQNQATAKANRMAVGEHIADLGASGVELTLDQISERNKQAALDIAVANDYKKRQQGENKAAQTMVVTSAVSNLLGTIAKAVGGAQGQDVGGGEGTETASGKEAGAASGEEAGAASGKEKKQEVKKVQKYDVRLPGSIPMLGAKKRIDSGVGLR